MRLEGALLGLLSFLTTFIGHNGVYMRHQKEKNLKKIKKMEVGGRISTQQDRWIGDRHKSKGKLFRIFSPFASDTSILGHGRYWRQQEEEIRSKKVVLKEKKKAVEDRALQFLRLSKFHPLKRSRGKKATKPHLLTPSLATLSSILFYHFLSFWL